MSTVFLNCITCCITPVLGFEMCWVIAPGEKSLSDEGCYQPGASSSEGGCIWVCPNFCLGMYGESTSRTDFDEILYILAG